MEHAVDAQDQSALLRAYEPVVRYTHGELFLPTAVGPYVQRCSLWIHEPGTPPDTAELLVPPGGFQGPGFRRSGPLAGCAARSFEPRRCRRASVRPLLVAHSLDRRPRNLRELISRRRCERKATPPQPGTDLAPLQTLSCCVPRVGQGCGGVWGRKWRRGLSLLPPTSRLLLNDARLATSPSVANMRSLAPGAGLTGSLAQPRERSTLSTRSR